MANQDALDDFIPLHRSFHELAQDETTTDETDLKSLVRDGGLHWDDLLTWPRVILLSEAGSGKTAEARTACRSLRETGKRAFFIRVEHVVQSFEDAFEEGTYEDFVAWTQAGDEGWLLLDSVDEARLKDPRDFERAVRKLGRLLAPVLAQAHIVITGRAVAWRPKTDLLLVAQALPYKLPTIATNNDSEKGQARAKTDGGEDGGFKIVALDDLEGEQIDRFATGKGVTNLAAFRAALERKDAWALTTRPMDLAEVCEYWIDKGEIGSRLDLMKSSIDRRLEEIDQNRSEAQPIAIDQLRRGAKLVAAAATLTQESGLRVPDGSVNTRGLPVKEVLSGWNDLQVGALLARPIFDEGIYGTVRFHHRSVREFLTAEWLKDLIVDQGSRTRIEALFFREQYGLEVVVPTMRPILPWLCLLDDRILGRTMRLAPEILFEGGDPSQLPRDTRVEILRQTCEQISQPAHGRSMLDFAAVQRFAHEDLTDEIRSLLAKHRDDDDIVSFLLRMVWIGELKGLAAESKALALSLRAHYPRLSAIRALISVGQADDLREVRTALLAEGDIVHRSWPAEFVATLPVDTEASDWLLRVLTLAVARKRFETDNLAHLLPDYVEKLPVDLIVTWVDVLKDLLSVPPFIERHYKRVSSRYGWLATIAARCVARLVEVRHPHALTPSTLWIVRNARENNELDSAGLKRAREALAAVVPLWPELRGHRLPACSRSHVGQLSDRGGHRG